MDNIKAVNSALVTSFEEIARLADRKNAKGKYRRFYIINDMSNHRKPESQSHTVGIYDSTTKKYVIEEINSHRIYNALEEMRNLLV